MICLVAIALTVYGIETGSLQYVDRIYHLSCNSAYRLRY